MFTKALVLFGLISSLWAGITAAGSNETSSNNTSITVEVKNTKKEVETKYGESVSLDCSVAVQDDADVNWMAGKNDIKKDNTSKYKYTGTPANKLLTINDLQASDRDVYTCTSIYMNATSTLKITLRVRDPLGALWPVIGIAIEIVLLFIVIFVYEHTKAKPEGKEIRATKGRDGEMSLIQ